jgi:long-chain acyl-CoA synthetase
MRLIDSSVTGFYRIAAAHPDRPALIGPGNRTLTFGELSAKVNGVSHALRALGLARGDVVATLVYNDWTYFELVLATGQLGLYLVPLNWHQAPSEVAYIVRDSGAKVLVADAALAAALTSVLGKLPENRFSVGGRVSAWMLYETLEGAATEPDDRSAGAIMGYTSGTTGRPKGVQRALADSSPEDAIGQSLPLFRCFGVDHDYGVHLICSPLYHSAPGGWATMLLHLGHTLVCHQRFDAELVLRDIERHRVTTSHMVPTHFHRLLKVPNRTDYDLSSLVALVHAGAPCPVAHKQAMIDWLGPIVWEYLGSTEGGWVSIVGPQEWLTRPGTVGKPAPGTTVKILDETGAEVPTGEAGTIYVRNARSNFVYHNDPAKTARSRVGAFATSGDIGRLDADGYLYILDRRVDLILSGGANIYPAEIEARLITHPAVRDVAVIGIADPEWGQSVLAVVQLANVAAAGAELAESLRAYCAEALASYKCPRRFEFRAEFPRTAAGKLERRVLRDIYNAKHDQGLNP